MEDKLSDFLPEPTVTVTFTKGELDLLLHFAEIGHNHIYVRNNEGDRDVARKLDHVLVRLSNTLKASK